MKNNGDEREQLDVIMALPDFTVLAALPRETISELNGVVYGFRKLILSRKFTLFRFNQTDSKIFGAPLSLVGVLMLSGADKSLEAILVDAAPNWILTISAML